MNLDHKHRYPWAVIETALLLYLKYNISFRKVSEKMQTMGVTVSHKSIMQWTEKFSNDIKIKRTKKIPDSLPAYTIRETFIRCGGKSMIMYEAITIAHERLGLLVREKRNLGAAERYFNKTIQPGD